MVLLKCGEFHHVSFLWKEIHMPNVVMLIGFSYQVELRYFDKIMLTISIISYTKFESYKNEQVKVRCRDMIIITPLIILYIKVIFYTNNQLITV